MALDKTKEKDGTRGTLQLISQPFLSLCGRDVFAEAASLLAHLTFAAAAAATARGETHAPTK